MNIYVKKYNIMTEWLNISRLQYMYKTFCTYNHLLCKLNKRKMLLKKILF